MATVSRERKKKTERETYKKKTQLQKDMEEISRLDNILLNFPPPCGVNCLALNPKKDVSSNTKSTKEGPKTNQVENLAFAGCELFEELPISERTKNALRDAKYFKMTEIQRASIPHSLVGRDILGAAKTGSGKTLAFLVPVLEKLYRLRWGRFDGVGCIIISPTRELAQQIFNELKRVGKFHSLSGGLLIGGQKDVQMEKDRVSALNILVCTPGRLLQHMDETPNFECSQLQMLVLDEADRILDMGFSETLNAIIENLPRKRQTMLFSATQTKSVKDLARLSLNSPEYVAVHEKSTSATPAQLRQVAMIVPLHLKLSMLWSFVRSHVKSKILVFLATCKQVSFVHESFKRLRPGLPVKHLHGRMSQKKRLIIFKEFCESSNSLLFSTDVASRGLDFPVVHWVIQLDCPDDVESYIHRVGRTARYDKKGNSLLFLLPSETRFLNSLEDARVPINLIKSNPHKFQDITPSLSAILSKDVELKFMAQRAFVTYLRSIHVQKNKEIFDVTKLPHAEFSMSLGLPNVPVIRFLKKQKQKQDQKNESLTASNKGSGSEPRTEEIDSEEKKNRKSKLGTDVNARSENESNINGSDDGKTFDLTSEEEGESEYDDEDDEDYGDSDEMDEEENEEVEEEIENEENLRENEWKKRLGLGIIKGEKIKNGTEVDETKILDISKDKNKNENEGAKEEEKADGDQKEKENEETMAEKNGKKIEKKKKSKIERLFSRKNLNVLSKTYEKLRYNEDEIKTDETSKKGENRENTVDDDDDDDDFLRLRRRNHGLEDEVIGKNETKLVKHETVEIPGGDTLVNTHNIKVKVKSKKKLKINLNKSSENRILFDEEGNAMRPFEAMSVKEASSGNVVSIVDSVQERYRKLKEEMKERDKEDRRLEKQRLREKRWKMKDKNRRVADEQEEEWVEGEDGEGEGAEEKESEGEMEQESQSWSRKRKSILPVVEEDLEDEENMKTKKNRGMDVSKLSISQSEQLALQLLNRKLLHH